ncbi:hypothetical protein ACP70R_036008 [Stipagrostis hirtigluma subsp. patula]
MMLPEGHGLYPGHPGLRGCVRFFNLSTGAFARAHLPLLHDHVILDSVDGLLLLHHDHDTAVRLLHPFTGDITDLPPLDSLMPQIQPHHICYGLEDKGSILRSVCAVVAVSATGTINVVLALYHLHRVAYAAAGDTRWVLSTWKLRSLMKPVAFQGKFYAMHGLYGPKYTIRINVIDPLRRHAGGSHSPSEPSPEKFVEWPRDKIAYYPVHLVECDSELLVVAYTDDSCAHLQVYRLADLMSSKMVPMASIGDHALFLGDRCLCLSPSTGKGLPSIIRNSIICMHTCIRTIRDVGRDENCRLEQYHLDSGIWTPASDGDCVHKPPSNPCTLIHHIFTCCHREYWNKGIIFCTQTEPVWLVKPNLRIGVLLDGLLSSLRSRGAMVDQAGLGRCLGG